MAFDREAVFIGSFNLDPRSAVINTEAGHYIDSYSSMPFSSSRLRVLAEPECAGSMSFDASELVRNRIPPALCRQSFEAPTDRLATLTTIAGRPR
jgi:phosphatidylserine/phosphatidylglycerophosphate/cardiolipin synthase-like enzyme